MTVKKMFRIIVKSIAKEGGLKYNKSAMSICNIHKKEVHYGRQIKVIWI